jgi:hypothetical protein
VIGGKPIADLLQCISGVSAINPLVALYDIHENKREVLFFYFVPDTTQDTKCYILTFLFPILIPLSGVGTTCFHHIVTKIRYLFLRPAACLSSTLLETGMDANDCKCSRDQQLNVLSEARRSSR